MYASLTRIEIWTLLVQSYVKRPFVPFGVTIYENEYRRTGYHAASCNKRGGNGGDGAGHWLKWDYPAISNVRGGKGS